MWKQQNDVFPCIMSSTWCLRWLTLGSAESCGDLADHLKLFYRGPLYTSGLVPSYHLTHCCFICQPSPVKKERSPRPQSFCHSSSVSPQDKLALPGFSTPRDKQRLSYGAFTNQMFVSTSTDSPTSPTAEAPPLPPRNAGKGMGLGRALPTPSSELIAHPALG